VLLALVIGAVIFFGGVVYDFASLYWRWATTIPITPYEDLNGIITITSLVGVSALIFVLGAFLTGGEGLDVKKGEKVTLSKALGNFIGLQIVMYLLLLMLLEGIRFWVAQNVGFLPDFKLESLNALFIGTQAVVAVTPFLSLFKRFAKFLVLIFLLLECSVSCLALVLLTPK